MVNYADYRLVYVAVSAGQKIFGFRKKNLLRDKLTTPIVSQNFELKFYGLDPRMSIVIV